MRTAKIDDEHANIQIVMKGGRDTVGKIADRYRPHHIGVRCNRAHEELVRHYFHTLHENGYWKELTKNAKTKAVHIKLSDVRKALTQLRKV
jgi:hypothetical protein